MRNKALLAAIALMLPAPAAVAQDLDTSQLQQRADMERNRVLVRSTLRQKQRADAGRRMSRNQAQANACANRGRFAQQYGANHPKVLKLQSLCARAGYW
ncbi:hypothetical protein AB2M62_14940 [Sphingomonas sp. MMS12-HWE2-04]|uniref:hypothetical protein n=1 Tax=Sphingomonas sp. MMS12-HWE2-04 TaxID=3234199 RepID=UPI003850792F